MQVGAPSGQNFSWKIAQVMNSIPWVFCASGHVLTLTNTFNNLDKNIGYLGLASMWEHKIFQCGGVQFRPCSNLMHPVISWVTVNSGNDLYIEKVFLSVFHKTTKDRGIFMRTGAWSQPPLKGLLIFWLSQSLASCDFWPTFVKIQLTLQKIFLSCFIRKLQHIHKDRS